MGIIPSVHKIKMAIYKKPSKKRNKEKGVTTRLDEWTTTKNTQSSETQEDTTSQYKKIKKSQKQAN